jgi:hypothetical protein
MTSVPVYPVSVIIGFGRSGRMHFDCLAKIGRHRFGDRRDGTPSISLIQHLRRRTCAPVRWGRRLGGGSVGVHTCTTAKGRCSTGTSSNASMRVAAVGSSISDASSLKSRLPPVIRRCRRSRRFASDTAPRLSSSRTRRRLSRPPRQARVQRSLVRRLERLGYDVSFAQKLRDPHPVTGFLGRIRESGAAAASLYLGSPPAPAGKKAIAAPASPGFSRSYLKLPLHK